jgi:soluble lytic murein transglycosylase-like protein
MRTLGAVGIGVLASLGLPASAAADILVFHTGRVMSVASVRADGDRLQLTLRDGGDASVPAMLIARIDPDEIPIAVPEAPTAPPGGPTDSWTPLTGSEAARLAARPFAELIASAAASHGVDLRLVHAVIEAESNYQPRARSRTGAKGLMQLMPATARQYAVGDPYDPRTNIEAGVRHLKSLLGRFELGLALAAYNAGEGAVRTYGGLPPFAETRAYVARILRQVGR